MGEQDINIGRNALGKLDPANKNSVFLARLKEFYSYYYYYSI